MNPSWLTLSTVILDDVQKAGMFNRQGLTIRQIWKCAKDYDMWPLYGLGLLFGLPKYPVEQYPTLSFSGLGFNVIESNLLTIPNVVGSCISMLLITSVSKLVNNRSIVAMAEDAWLLPCFVALIASPDPISPWSYLCHGPVDNSLYASYPSRLDEQKRGFRLEQNGLRLVDRASPIPACNIVTF